MIQLGDLQILPPPSTVPELVEDFLEALGQPTLFRIPGRDRSRCRALCTLLHGNEPSGVMAVHRWLRERETPAVDLLIFIGAVRTALQPPLFFYRQLPGRLDLNRCFRAPFLDQEGQVAASFLRELEDAQPECLIDIHNTSGSGPAFCISIHDDSPHRALAALFSDQFVINHLRMGALMEYSEREVPTITVECGGARDEHAHQLAYEGLKRYVSRDDVLSPATPDAQVQVLKHPVRVEVVQDARVAFDSMPVPDYDLTLPPDIERFNFDVLTEDRPVGWLGPRGLDIFRIEGENQNLAPGLLRQVDGKLYPAQPMRAFMITTNPVIAKSDCLFYVVKPDGRSFMS